ncbi:hypothetical protein NGRA_2680, partial [Nosema granulosis]
MQNTPINNYNYDMATAMDGVREYSGDPNENADSWLRDITLISRLGGFSEETTLRAIVLKLRSNALSWASELLESRQWVITVDEFIACFKKRFININQTEISLVKFLTSPPPATREEFSKLLESGTILYERNMMNTTALTQVLLTKSPDALKPLLFTAAEQANDWQSFIQRAEQVAFIAYPDKMLNRIEARAHNKAQNYIDDSKKVIRSNNSFQNRNQNNNFNRNIANKGNTRNRQVANNYNNNSSFICEIHGRGTQTSEECCTLKNMISRGWSRPTRINCVENESISDIENEGED